MKLIKMTKANARKYRNEMGVEAYLMLTSKFANQHPHYGMYEPMIMVSNERT